MPLDRKKVVSCALRLLDRVGLEGLTLRKLAAELRVQAPALYWHFKNKQELLDEMATAMLLESVSAMLPGETETGDWSKWAADFGKELRAVLLRHRDGAKMFSGTYLTDANAFEPMESALRKFTTAGFSSQNAVLALKTIYCYTIGFTIEEQAVSGKPGKRDPRYDPAARAKRIDAERLPMVLAAGEAMHDSDAQFEQGLQIIIGGVRTLVKRRRSS